HQPARHLAEHVAERTSFLLRHLLCSAVDVRCRADGSHAEQRGHASHTTPPRWSRRALKLLKALDTPAVKPDAALTGLPIAEDTVRTEWSSESAASTALSVMWLTLPSSSFTWSSVTDVLPSIGTSSVITCFSETVTSCSVPPILTSM